MPNWKKLIVSGSDASLNSLNVTNNVTAQSFTGSFSGSFTAPGATTQVVYNSGGVLAASSNFVFSGSRVGIGTTSPGAKLHVGGGEIRVDAGQAVTLDTSNSMYLVGASNQLRLYNGGNPVVNITTGGNVGIGTTSPVEKLSLAGSTATTFGLSLEPSGWNSAKHRLTVPTSGDVSMWSFNWNGTAVDSALYATSAITVAQGVITLSTTGSANSPAARMTINSAGNVGIGTASPSFKLEVSGSAKVTYLQIQDNGYAGGLPTTPEIYSPASATLAISAGGAERMRITSAGNVGIGTTSPGAKLEVAGSDAILNGVTFGRGPGSVPGSNHNIAIGVSNYSSSLSVSRAHIAVGYQAFKNVTAGYYSMAIGGYAMDAALEPDETIAIGLDALGSATYPGHSVAVGNQALFADTEGYGNVAVGSRAGSYYNSALGGYGDNTFVGNYAASQLKNARETTALGAGALQSVTSNTNLSRGNIALGASAGYAWASGSYNTWIGYNTNGFATGSNNTIIGGRLSTTAVNGTEILNSSIVLADGAGNIRVFTNSTGNVGIGTTSPTQKLDVAGAISVSGSVVDYEVSPGLIGPGPGSNIVSFTPGTHYAAFMDYVIKDSSTGANQRVGTIMISISLAGAAAVMNEVVTADIGNTSAITFSVTYGAPTWLVAANSGITPFDINYMVRYF